MADVLQFSRSTRVYISQAGTEASLWEIPVLDGFSFSHATNATEIVLSEMTSSLGASRRARAMFTDSYAPAEWSFSTYARPNASGAVEEALWANFIAANDFVAATVPNQWTEGVTKANPVTTFDFGSSNSTILGEFDIYFVLGGCGIDASTVPYNPAGGQTIYKISGAVANTASVDFEIDGISMITWSGFGSIITEEASLDATSAIVTGITGTGNFIRNRLTTLSCDGSNTSSAFVTFDADYSLVLTGGNITFENNITYLTPETLCTVNQPIGHITGARSISGNFTCYLNAPTAGVSSAELFEDIIAATDVVTNSFDLSFGIGGSTAPKIAMNFPNCHLEVPQHSIEDVISIDTTFNALPSTIDAADEATIVYTGV
jgi:hypothetical protein